MISNHFTPKIGVEVAILKREKTQGGLRRLFLFLALSPSFSSINIHDLSTAFLSQARAFQIVAVAVRIQ